VVTPLLAGIAQMIHGGEVLIKKVEKTWSDAKIQVALGSNDSNDCIGDLFDRPSRVVASQEAGMNCHLRYRFSAFPIKNLKINFQKCLKNLKLSLSKACQFF